jgi:hypothetical protein
VLGSLHSREFGILGNSARPSWARQSGTIGVAGGELVGTAYNLRTAADIAGTYRTAAAGLTVGGGAQVARFQNANGVILELVGAQLGLEVSVGSAGMTIVLQ